MTDSRNFERFEEFYPYYLSEHQNRVCRGLHYIGTSLALLIVVYAIVSKAWILILPGIVSGYVFAWIGHFFFEHNKPATFQYPLYSFVGDWVMLKDFLTGKLGERLND